MSNKLLPCPFCGGAGTLVVFLESRMVICDKCKATTATGSRDEAIEAWNTRAPDPRVEKLVGALKEIAMQHTTGECERDDDGEVSGDVEAGYDTIIKVARAALAEWKEGREG